MGNYRDIELLAPAGDYETLICAIENGADAVYIGGKTFSARKNAKNFTDEEIEKAVRYAHLRGAKVYVTLNTLIQNDELSAAFDFIKFCYEKNVDAMIVQDLAIVAICNKYFPDFEIHSSTQMTVSSIEGVKMMEKLGFSRAVLAREMSESEISNVCKNTGLEIEVFVHGALCVCYSGQCLFSSIIGSRSGNRGDCAQPCRLPYEIYDYSGNKAFNEPKYLLSLKDYNLIDKLDNLNSIGVKSLKIEGRMKNKEYVSVVTSVYNKKFGKMPLVDFDYFKLKNIFSRSGFTTGYFDGKIGKHMINSEKNNDDIYRNVTEEVLNDAAALVAKKSKLRDVDFKITIGKTLTCNVKSGNIEFDICPDVNVQTAKTSPISAERVKEQFKKLGDTAFKCGKISVEIKGNYFVAVSELNTARRECIARLEETILHSDRKQISKIFEIPKKPIKLAEKKNFNAEVTTFSQAKYVLTKNFDYVFVPYEVVDKNREFFKNYTNIVCVLPQADNISYNLDGFDKISVSNIGQINIAANKEIFSEPSLNVFNSLSADMYSRLGVEHIALSYELNVNQISQIEAENLEIVIYGRIPLMNTKSCLHKSFLGGCKCNENKFFKIKDRKNKIFPVKSNPINCTNTIYNSDPIYMADKFNTLSSLPVSSYRLLFTTETENEIDTIIDLYKSKSQADFSFTRGHYFRGV